MQQELRANELASDWLSSFDGVKVLSLDCFDTLLWRKVAAPTDVFFTLAQSPEFQRLGLTAPLRARAEAEARRINWITRQSYEVSIEEIYRQAVPRAGADEIAALAARELACEIDYCFVFKPVFELVVQARQQGLKVVIVSDTYLSEAQLKRLLFSAMPELEGLLDAVYCSSAHGLSKAAGIWRKVLPLLGVRPEQVLHLGDNLEADLRSPQRFGIRSAHLVHQHEDVAKIFAGRDQAAVQLLPELRHREPLPSYFHAQIAASRHSDPLSTFGYASMGPILYAFADFILAERRQLEAAGARVKLAFLLRDGYLPSKACAALAGQAVGSELNISRFTAIAASLDSKERVVALLSKMLAKDSIEVLARQLLLPAELAQKVINRSQRAAQPEVEFAELVLQKQSLQAIMAASAAFRRRLVAHVRKVTGVEPGDTLMFVDLGYSGTAQNLLKDVLKQDLDVELVGRYLIADHVLPDQSDRRGLLDATRIDGRVVQALTGNYIAGFEMLCTQNAPSTVDYTEAGEPVYSASAFSDRQHASVAAIQAGCLRFIADARALPARHKPSADERHAAQSAAIDLARLLYFPTQMELDCMSQFQFDFNLGTDTKMALFDTEAGLRDMRRQGFGYMNAGLSELRTNYTMELRQLDLSLSVLLFAQNRFGFGMQPANASYRQELLRVLVTNRGQHVYREIAANATYDGYFSLCVPLAASFDVGILFGKSYSWVQVDSVQLIRNGDFQGGVDMEPGEAILFDAMEHQDNGLFQVGAGGMMYLPGLGGYGPNLMCRIIFRPIAYAQPETLA